MRKIFWILIGLLFVSTSCSKGPTEKTVTIVNAAAVDVETLESFRQFAEKELHVPVRAIEKPKLATKKDLQALQKSAMRMKHENDVSYIVLAGFEGEKTLTVNTNCALAIVNIQPLWIDDSETFRKRIQRMVMRAAAFTFGLPPTPDPFCVTRDYRSLEDLDRMGNNFSPPWQGRFADEAAKRGLQESKPASP